MLAKTTTTCELKRCLDGGDSVNVEFVLQMFENTNNDFDAKEIEKLKSLSLSSPEGGGFISR